MKMVKLGMCSVIAAAFLVFGVGAVCIAEGPVVPVEGGTEAIIAPLFPTNEALESHQSLVAEADSSNSEPYFPETPWQAVEHYLADAGVPPGNYSPESIAGAGQEDDSDGGILQAIQDFWEWINGTTAAEEALDAALNQLAAAEHLEEEVAEISLITQNLINMGWEAVLHDEELSPEETNNILEEIEQIITDPDADNDGNGTPDILEMDDNNENNIPDEYEIQFAPNGDFDNDGIPNDMDPHPFDYEQYPGTGGERV